MFKLMMRCKVLLVARERLDLALHINIFCFDTTVQNR